MALTVDHYTRGAPGGDLRGDSMLQKHRDKLQKEKEAALLKRLTTDFALLPVTVLRLAAQEVDWEAGPASALLSVFQQAAQDQLAALTEQYGPSPVALVDRPVEIDADKRKQKHTSKHRPDKKHRKERSKKKVKREGSQDELALTAQYGRYGIIRDADISSKHSEFALWATDTQRIDVELLPKLEEKELFKTYMEDYNTGTLPHKKYYDHEAYEAQRAAKAAKKRTALDKEKTAFNDEEERKKELAAQRAQEAEDRLREAYNELKYTARDKIGDMKEQELMRMQMGLAYRTGDHETAAKLAERLKPDDQKDQNRPDEGLKPL